jgi:hypothetical protein
MPGILPLKVQYPKDVIDAALPELIEGSTMFEATTNSSLRETLEGDMGKYAQLITYCTRHDGVLSSLKLLSCDEDP